MKTILKKIWETLMVRRLSRVLFRQMEAMLKRVDGMPTIDNRSADEILGYDENGLLR